MDLMRIRDVHPHMASEAQQEIVVGCPLVLTVDIYAPIHTEKSVSIFITHNGI